MEELDVVSKSVKLMEIIDSHVKKVDTGKRNTDYLVDYLFGLAKFSMEIADENPGDVHKEVTQYVFDTITNLTYFIRDTEDLQKKELYEVALEGFREIEKDIISNNL